MQKKNKTIPCQYYEWILFQRPSGVWYADGRSLDPPCGRQSLGTKDYEEAKQKLFELDRFTAVKNGLADKSILGQSAEESVGIAEGISKYLDHCRRPEVLGGIRENSIKRYRTVFDKFQVYSQSKNIKYWNQVSDSVLGGYVSWLVKNGYADATLVIETSTLKGLNIWLIDKELLPEKCRIKLTMKKVEGTSTYCWKPEEVKAILNFCRENPKLIWLWRVLTTLARTGMRISEVCSLKWRDISLDKRQISLTDEFGNRRISAKEARRTKNGRDRLIPIDKKLLPVFKGMEPGQKQYVFAGPHGGRLKADTVLRTMKRDVLNPLAEQFPTPVGEIGFLDGRLHSFRHFFCSQCANKGVPERILMSWLGHSDSRMVQHYYRLHDTESHQQMDQIDVLE